MQLHEEYSNGNIFGNLTCLQHFPSQNLNFTYLLNCNVSTFCKNSNRSPIYTCVFDNSISFDMLCYIRMKRIKNTSN